MLSGIPPHHNGQCRISPESKVQQGVDAHLVEPGHHLAVHHQGGRRANAQTEQLIPGLFVDHEIFSNKCHPFAGQILCQCRAGASEGLRIHRNFMVSHMASFLVIDVSLPPSSTKTRRAMFAAIAWLSAPAPSAATPAAWLLHLQKRKVALWS